jgi:hypothetical protein
MTTWPRRNLAALSIALGLGCGSAPEPPPPPRALVMFLIDGLMDEAVQTAAASGAGNLAFVLANGVRVQTARTTSPAAAIQLPDGTRPWGAASSGNVAVHTGCHLFESMRMDDIFLAARAAGMKSVFSGGHDNYAVFTTPDFHYSGMTIDDTTVVQHAIDHMKHDGARLLRLHLQRIRDFWTGPADKKNPDSPYIRHLLEVDALLGRLIEALRESGIWDSTYLIVAADHGMGETSISEHGSTALSSWQPFIAFYGPDLKKGATIPYAELPDLAVTGAHFLGLRPLEGHLDPAVGIPVKAPTGTVLTNLFQGAPETIPHPRYLETCLAMGAACTGSSDDFAPYRQVMLDLIK